MRKQREGQEGGTEGESSVLKTETKHLQQQATPSWDIENLKMNNNNPKHPE